LALKNEAKMTNDIFLEKFVDFAAVATFVITPEHEVIYWNKSCEILTGVKSVDVVGTKNHWQAFYDHLRPCLSDLVLTGEYDILPELYKIYSKSILIEDGLHAEGWFENLGGNRRYIIFDAAPVYNKAGEIIAAIETLQDRSGEKELEEKKENMFLQLQETISKMEILKGYIPICASCKSIRVVDNNWVSIEKYISDRTEAKFSHGICPDCARKLYPEFYKNK